VTPGPRVAAIVLAAGSATRFGGAKLVAPLEGRPLLQHVLDRLADAGLVNPIVVLPPDATALEDAVEWRDAQRAVNPDPSRGLSTSLQVGWAAALATVPPPDAALVLLGDQPRVSPGLIERLIRETLDPAGPVIVPRYGGGGGGNPVRIERGAAALVTAAEGDRGLGPLIAAHPELVRWVDVDGSNPDVDTPADLHELSPT